MTLGAPTKGRLGRAVLASYAAAQTAPRDVSNLMANAGVREGLPATAINRWRRINGVKNDWN